MTPPHRFEKRHKEPARQRFGLTRRAAPPAGLAVAIVAIATVDATGHGWLFVNDSRLHSALLTAAGLTTLAAAIVCAMRCARSSNGSRLALALGLWVVAATMMLSAIPALEPSLAGEHLAWVPVPGRVVGGLLLVLAGWRWLPVPRTSLGWRWFAALAGASTLALAGAGFATAKLTGAVVPDWIQFATMLIYAAAAGALLERSLRLEDRALAWFAAGVAGLALSRLALVVLAPPAEDWFSAGDIVKLAAGLLLLTGALTELSADVRTEAARMLADQRNCIARDIHDGPAQELAFIVGQTRRLLGEEPHLSGLRLVEDAGQAALADTREMIYDLNRSTSVPLSCAIADKSFQLTSRAGMMLELEFDGEAEVTREVEGAILRIVSEAISNAAKHGAASRVFIRLAARDSGLALSICDNGEGFDPQRLPSRRSNGLAGIRNRAAAIGGITRLDSKLGAGTTVEVLI